MTQDPATLQHYPYWRITGSAGEWTLQQVMGPGVNPLFVRRSQYREDLISWARAKDMQPLYLWTGDLWTGGTS